MNNGQETRNKREERRHKRQGSKKRTGNRRGAFNGQVYPVLTCAQKYKCATQGTMLVVLLMDNK